MKRTIIISALLTLCCLPMAAQLNGTGFYRLRNAQNTTDYISMANDKFSYQFLFGSSTDSKFGKANQVGGGLSNLSSNTTTVKDLVFKAAEIFLRNGIHLEEDGEIIDPSTILYLQKTTGSYYNIIGQGTSLLTLTTGAYEASVRVIFNDIAAQITSSSGSGKNTLYTASINIAATDVENISYNSFMFSLGKSTFLNNAKLGKYYFYDNNGSFAIQSSNSDNKTKWYIEPITDFNVKPEVNYNGKYYTTLCVPFAYKLSGEVNTAYAVESIGDDGMLNLTTVAVNGESVPAGTPVILECGSDLVSNCVLQIENAEPLFTAAINNTQYAPTASTQTNYTATNLLKSTYFKNEDQPFNYQYNRSGTSTQSTLTLQNYTEPTSKMYVLGITESGKLGMVKATGTAMPANKAWIEYSGSKELLLPFKSSILGDVNRDGEIDVNDVSALVNIIQGRDSDFDYDYDAADMDGNGEYDVTDVSEIINIIQQRK